MNMGQSIAIKGELSGAEDLTLEGQLEGKISLPENVLTVGKSARINAEVIAKAVVVLGQLVGQRDREGEVRAAAPADRCRATSRRRASPMADGAVFNGKVEMPGGKPRAWCSAGAETPGGRGLAVRELGSAAPDIDAMLGTCAGAAMRHPASWYATARVSALRCARRSCDRSAGPKRGQQAHASGMRSVQRSPDR